MWWLIFHASCLPLRSSGSATASLYMTPIAPSCLKPQIIEISTNVISLTHSISCSWFFLLIWMAYWSVFFETYLEVDWFLLLSKLINSLFPVRQVYSLKAVLTLGLWQDIIIIDLECSFGIAWSSVVQCGPSWLEVRTFDMYGCSTDHVTSFGRRLSLFLSGLP